jgi:hypothetical protein
MISDAFRKRSVFGKRPNLLQIPLSELLNDSHDAVCVWGLTLLFAIAAGSACEESLPHVIAPIDFSRF